MMPNDHPGDELLVLYSEDSTALPDRVAIEEHLLGCPACISKLAEYRTIEGALRDRETWMASELAEEFAQEVALEARITREDADAERILRPLLESPYRFAAANVARKKRFHNGGVVRLLCRTAYDECDRQPLFALDLAEAATFIAEVLPDNSYPAEGVNEFRGSAWKEYSTACRYLGRFDEGLQALQRAERAYRRLPFPTPGVSSVKLGRAIILWYVERYEEALCEVQKAARGFTSYGDSIKFMDAKQVQAVILHRQGNLAAACETYKAMYEAADTLNDPELRARAARNLGVMATEQGDLGTASKYLIIALQGYEGLEQHAMVLQVRWRIAVLALAAGNFDEAVRRLRNVEGELEAAGMTSSAAAAKLDLAEALLMTGETEEVKVLCESLVAHFRAANMLSGALTAAAFLREAAVKRELTPRHFQRVRKYLAELEWNPELAFLEQPDL